jgi:LPXTG-motif cell wall-anchored protein
LAEPETGRLATHAANDASRGPGQRPGRFAALARGSNGDAPRSLRPLETAFAALALAAAGALIASYFATVVYVTTRTASCQDLATPLHSADCVKTGGDQHSIAFILLGLALLALAGIVVARGVRTAAAGIAAIGAAALLIALIADLPQTHRAGALASDFSAAKAHAGAGLALEIAGGALAVVAAAVGFRCARSRERQLYP